MRKENKDTKRINWLEEHNAGLNTQALPTCPHVWVNIDGVARHFNGETYRDAIDIAMKELPYADK